jgi:Xaa-Pro aminopeptidase
VLLRDRTSDGLTGVTSSCPYFVLKVVEDCALQKSLAMADDVMEELRLIKSAEEVLRLRRSADIMEATFRELFDLLRVGMGRSELAREARSRLLRNGATGISHITLSFTQANPEVDIDEALETNRLVTIDIGGIYHGYCSDARRYAYTGSVPEPLQDRYKRMVEIVDTVGGALVPGRSFESLFNFALEQYAKHGVAPVARFSHIGHNIGLETEERWLDASSSHSVKTGMVITIELYSIADTGEQVGNEDTYVIGESVSSRISGLPREIRVIR